ncbi:MAG: SGNH/GDSL hydrolase family protein, partial [Lysobacterales bacterium]
MSLTQPYPTPLRGAKLTRWSVLAGAMLALAGFGLVPVAMARDASNASQWVATWSASPQSASNPADLTGVTTRQIVHVSIGGQRVRVRLSNAFGTDALVIGAARVARRSTGASIVAGTDRVLTFNGSPTTTIPPGALAVSDPVNLKVPDLADLAVSLYLGGNAVAATEHTLGLQTTYVSAAGDFSGASDLLAARTTEAFYFLTGVEVVASRQSAAIVTLGDSITDGLNSTADANRRWPNRLAERLRAQKVARKVAVLNAGISGNRLLRDIQGTSALARLDRDVLVQSGARYLIVLLGINDI